MAKARAITGLDLQAPTGRNARIIVRERLTDMYAFAKYIEDPKYIQQLHDLRIATKRVRYTLEVFAEFLPEASKHFVAELAALQEELGDLHDSEVMLVLLRLALQQGQEDGLGKRREELHMPEAERPLITPDMMNHLLDLESLSALNEQRRAGLANFLLRQEQRRVQCYATFRQHWDQLEQQHFRAELLKMLEKNTL